MAEPLLDPTDEFPARLSGGDGFEGRFAVRVLRSSRLMRIVLALLLLMPSAAGVSAQASATPAAFSYDQAKGTLDRLLVEAQQIHGQLDASLYDLDTLSAKLGIKADDIVTYVRENIAFEQYPGLLRGAKWTLIGRAGNSIDEAVLLATLLARAGYQIKIQHGALNPEQATLLLLQMQAPRKAPDKIGNLDAIKTLIEQMARTAGVADAAIKPYLDSLGDEPAIPASDSASLNAGVASITTALAAVGVKLGDSTNLATLANEASDYFWVSYRRSIDDKWTDAHPAFKDGADAPVVTATESFDSIASIPSADKQTVKIEPIIERSIGGVLSQKSLSAPIEGPASELAGQPMFFTTLSNAAAAVDCPSAQIGDVLNKANLFAVQFNTHAVDNTTVVFDSHGTLFHLKQLKPGEFGLQPSPGEAVSAAVSNGIAAFAGEPTPTPGPAPNLQLTGVWINVTFMAPGGQETTVKRVIVDRIGQANRDAGKTTIANPNDGADVAAQLAQNISMFASAGQSSTGYLADQFFQRLDQVSTFLRSQLRARYFPNEDGDISNAQREAVGTAWAGFPVLLANFGAIAQSNPKVVSYRPAPAFVMHRQEIVRDSTAQDGWGTLLSVDILSNPRRAYSIADGSLALSPNEGIRAGVWETHSEKSPDAGAGQAIPSNTTAVMSAATSQGIATKVVRSAADLAGLDLMPEGMSHLKDDLAAGYVAIVPVKRPNGQALNGWWRVDPKTGVTLGMLENGRGAEMSEYGMLIRPVACVGFLVRAGFGPLSIAVGCGFGAGGAAIGYGGASAFTGEIISALGIILGGFANKAGL